MVGESDFYPWGGELKIVNNFDNAYKFTGKERDAESGLDYFGARYYGNALRRFLTPDWAAKATTVPYAQFGNPQTLNLTLTEMSILLHPLKKEELEQVWRTFLHQIIVVGVAVGDSKRKMFLAVVKSKSILSRNQKIEVMTCLEKLLSISSEPLASAPRSMPEFLKAYALGPELFHMLQQRNGFYAFELALHVFPLTTDPASGLEAWNSDSLWRYEYRDLAEGLLFFAEDILQDQFCLSTKQSGVLRFYAESGQTDLLAESLEKWAERILSNYRVETGWPLAHEWQAKNGPLPRGQRLMPRIPFFMGGEYGLENLWAGNPLEGMRLKGDLATQTRDLPSGTKVKLNIATKPE